MAGPSRFTAILFDLGDTLIYYDGNWPEVFAQARQAMLRSLQDDGVKVGKEFLDDFYARMEGYYRERDTGFIEYTTHYVLRLTLNDWGYQGLPDEVSRRALVSFHQVTQASWHPEEDAIPTLQTLQQMGYHMAMISNAADDANTQELVDKLGARPYMEFILSSAAQGIRKPNPLIFIYALEQMGVAPQRAMMVGDTLGADILGAHNAGMFAVWITRRADRPSNRAHTDTIQPDAQVARLSELPGLLRRLEAES